MSSGSVERAPVVHLDGDFISGGSSSLVILLPNGTVRKIPWPTRPEECRLDIEIEYEVYRDLPPHPRLLQMHAYSREQGLELEHMPNGDLKEYLKKHHGEITMTQRLQWMCDAAEAVEHLHANSIIHADIKPSNFLLDADMRLRIIDFAGLKTPSRDCRVFGTARFTLPRSQFEPPTFRSHIFALDSTLYEIATGDEPYHEMDDEEEVTRLYSEQTFPALEDVIGGDSIAACWLSESDSVAEAYEMLQHESVKVQQAPT